MPLVYLPASDTAPETNLFIKIVKRDPENKQAQWDRKVMLLISGGPGGDHSLYEEIETELLEHADLIIVDLRGCGLSDYSDIKHCSLQQDIYDIEALLNTLKIKQPIIFGCSYGAFVALGHAIHYPNSASKLVLVSAATSYEFIEKAKRNLLARGSKEQIEIAELLWEGKFSSLEQVEKYSKIMAPLYFYNYQPQDTLLNDNAKIPYNIKLNNHAYTSYLRTFDYREYLNNIKASTLILSGKDDWIVDPSEAVILNNGISESQLVSFDKCGHLPWKDRKEAFFSSINRFFNYGYSGK